MPTFKEDNKNVVFSNWRGLFASKSLNREGIKALKEKIAGAKDSSYWQIQLDRYGWTPFYLEDTDFKKFLVEQEAQMRKTLVKLNMI